MLRSARVSAAMIVAATSYLTAERSVLLAAPDIVVGSDERRTYDCRGGSATVRGGFNVLTLRNCSKVVVDGGDNTIDAGVVDAIEVAGADNRITWTESADGRRPRIINEGEGNVIVSKPAAAGTAAVKEGSAGTPNRSSGQAPAAGKIRIDQDRQRGSHDCRGASAVVNGDTNELSFRNCDQVSVNGDANAVAVRGVQSVLINGNDNKLTWELAEDGSRPRITDNGRGNTVSGKR
jgi:hypothetical protein